jgi:hypothetical protein
MHQSTNQTKENAINRKLSYRKRRSGGADLTEKTLDEDVSVLADLRGLLWIGLGALEAWRRRSRPWTRSGDPRRDRRTATLLCIISSESRRRGALGKENRRRSGCSFSGCGRRRSPSSKRPTNTAQGALHGRRASPLQLSSVRP